MRKQNTRGGETTSAAATPPGCGQEQRGGSNALAHGVLRVGLLGLGTVGAGVAEILARHGDLIAQRTGVRLELVRALVREPSRARPGAAAQVLVTRDAEQVVAAADVDIVVEALGGLEPAYALIMAALAHGKPVVTANKALLAARGSEIFRAAATHGVDVYFEAAVAGGIPIIRTLREGLAADRITRIRGILNGTTNFILSLMEQGESYASALAQAQALGYAEADPTLDVNGRDAADKLAILIQLAFGTTVQPHEICTQGITVLQPEVLSDARELGYRVKLLAVARRIATAHGEALDARVSPVMVPVRDVLSSVPANQNAIAVESDALGYSLYLGPGAGGLPTGSAVVADLIEAGRNMRAGISGRVAVDRARCAPQLLQSGVAASPFYVRLLVDDKPGVLASVAQIFAVNDISLATVLQRERSGDAPVPLVVTTHRAAQSAMDRALAAVEKLEVLHGGVSVLPLETDTVLQATT